MSATDKRTRRTWLDDLHAFAGCTPPPREIALYPSQAAGLRKKKLLHGAPGRFNSIAVRVVTD